MNKKYLHILAILVLLVVSISIPTISARAVCTDGHGCSTTCTTGQNCWYKDAAYTTSNGTFCSSDAITVAGSPTTIVSGTYGGVNNELRWSAHCIVNWTQGKVATTANSTYQMGIRAVPSNSGYYAAEYWTGVTVGFQKYTLMVDGNATVTANTGLYNALCTGATDSHNRSTGWGGTPTNCTNLYNPKASASA
jgi:hypothetical protein